MASISEIQQVSIQQFNSLEECPPTEFTVLDCRVKEKALEILIEYRSQEVPEVQAYWDNVHAKLYLVGGSVPTVSLALQGHVITGFHLPKAIQVWIRADLSLEQPSEVNICEVESASFAIGVSEEGAQEYNKREVNILTVRLP